MTTCGGLLPALRSPQTVPEPAFQPCWGVGDVINCPGGEGGFQVVAMRQPGDHEYEDIFEIGRCLDGAASLYAIDFRYRYVHQYQVDIRLGLGFVHMQLIESLLC